MIWVSFDVSYPTLHTQVLLWSTLIGKVVLGEIRERLPENGGGLYVHVDNIGEVVYHFSYWMETPQLPE